MKSLSLYKKHINTKNQILFSTIINLFLIENNVRRFAQLDLWNFHKKFSIKTVLNFLAENRVPFQHVDDRIILGKNKPSFQRLDKTFGKRYGKQLGKFYKCATKNFHKNKFRIVIHTSSKHCGVELFAQMCNRNDIRKNLVNIYEIFTSISGCLQKLDKELDTIIKIYKI